MKAGVRISPRGVRITPVRAAPSRAASSKSHPIAVPFQLLRPFKPVYPALQNIPFPIHPKGPP